MTTSIRRIATLSFLLLLTAALAAPPAGAQEPDFPEIRVGDAVEGRLISGGPTLLETGPLATYRFRGEAGRRYQAHVRSDEFDTYLVLAYLTGGITEFLREDDDGGEGTDSLLRFPIERTGDYLLIVRSWRGEDLGRFTLSLDEWELPPPATPRPIAPGEAVVGRLDEGSSLFVTDWDEEIPHDLWTFEGRGGEYYRISLESDAFDAYLDFGPMSGDEVIVQHSDDDGGEGWNAMLLVELPHDGRFGVRARPLGGLATGSYTLRVEPFTPAPPARRAVEAGQPVTGWLGRDDAILENAIPFQEWVYQGQAGESLRIRMRSDDFDTYLSLGREGPGGEFEELTYNDDAPDDGLNSLIEFQLPASGEYVIRARSFGSGATGEYTLEVRREG